MMREAATLPDRCLRTNQPADGGRLRRVFYQRPPSRVRGVLGFFAWLSLLLVLLNSALMLVDRFIAALIVVLGCGGMAVYEVFAAKEAKKEVEIRVSKRWLAKRQRVMFAGWSVALVGIAVAVFAAMAVEESPHLALWMPAGLAVALLGLVCVLLGSKAPHVKRVGDGHIWLGGVHPDFLAELPDWPNDAAK